MTADAYHSIAKIYDVVFEPVLKSSRATAMKMWPPQKGELVLDIGCGTGAQLDLYRRAGCEVVGIDPSPAMVTRARRKLGSEARVDLGDASHMPYAAASFDLILMSLVLHELADTVRSAVIAEAKRVLKTYGRMLIFDYHPGPLRFPRGWLAKPLILIAERMAGYEHFRNYREFLADGGIPRLAAQHQLVIEASRIIKGGNFALFLLAEPFDGL
jgi:ubiquinone/menaquinone biosynthesis C-methylase UbiE